MRVWVVYETAGGNCSRPMGVFSSFERAKAFVATWPTDRQTFAEFAETELDHASD